MSYLIDFGTLQSSPHFLPLAPWLTLWRRAKRPAFALGEWERPGTHPGWWAGVRVRSWGFCFYIPFLVLLTTGAREDGHAGAGHARLRSGGQDSAASVAVAGGGCPRSPHQTDEANGDGGHYQQSTFHNFIPQCYPLVHILCGAKVMRFYIEY